MEVLPDDGRQQLIGMEKIMQYIEFGKDRERVYPLDQGYLALIRRALIARGYTGIETGQQDDPGWMEGATGFAVHQVAGGTSRMLAFTANGGISADKVIEALKVAEPGRNFEKTLINRPE